MRILIALFTCTLLFGCGGSLTEDQREALKEEKESRKIRKISEDDIYEKTLQIGREVMKEMNSNDLIAEVENKHKVDIIRVNESTPGLDVKEKEIWELYKNSDWTTADEEQENIQKIGLDYLIYTVPVVAEKEDSVFLSAVWMVRIERREVVGAL